MLRLDLLGRPPRARACLAAVLASLLLLLLSTVAGAQQRDSARAGVAAPTARDTARRAVLPDTVPGPPISPKRAFFSSLLVPGLGQAALDRPIAGAIFVAVEAVSLVMIQKSQRELDFAKRVGGIGIPCAGDGGDDQLCLDPDGSGGGDYPNRYSGGRLAARRQHVEDWFALLFANHLLAGADAYVAAHLWDLPARVSLRPSPAGVAVAASAAW